MKNQKKNQIDYLSKEKASRISIDLSTSTERENHEGENERTLFRAIIYQALLDASATEITSKENMVIQQECMKDAIRYRSSDMRMNDCLFTSLFAHSFLSTWVMVFPSLDTVKV